MSTPTTTMTSVLPRSSYRRLQPDQPPPSYLQPGRRPDHAAARYAPQPTDSNDTSREYLPTRNLFASIRHAQSPLGSLHAAPESAPGSRGQPVQQHNAAEGMNPRPAKRRRSRGPDWDEFYRNGVPKEVIVIDDDTPEPEPHAASKTAKATKTSNSSTNATSYITSGTAHSGSSRHADQNQQMRKLPDPKQDPGLYTHSRSISNRNAQSERDSHTSISSSSLDQNGSSQPLKRKRTRQQEASEAKRMKVDVSAAGYHTYQPPRFPPKKAPEVVVRAAADPYRHKHPKVDDEDGHYVVVPGAMITDRYQINKLLGQGTFGKVVEAHDRRRNAAVAIKVIRSVQKYRDASRIELRVLATLKANEEENRYRCIHFRDCFDFRGHICIVTDLLGKSIFDFLKGNGFVPFPMSQIQSFARQLFTSVAFLHGLNLIHTDLKPENILLCDDKFQTFTYNRKIPSASTNVSRTATQRRVLLDTEMRLIDFGSATFDDEYHSSVVSTRHYRAPEIILGLGWSYPCDIWSIGCILVEFFTGDALFQTHDNLEHLAMMEAVFDKRIDTSLIQKVNRISGSNSASKYFKRLKLDYPKPDTKKSSVKFVRAMKQLEQIIPGNNMFMLNFLNLLSRIFVYDPKKRITAEEALQHPWFQDVAHADDGTEAAKIRLERTAMAEQAQLRE